MITLVAWHRTRLLLLAVAVAVAMLPPRLLPSAPGELGPPIFEQGACRVWFGSMHAWNVQEA